MTPAACPDTAEVFPLCTFERVFDTSPVQDALTLQQLMLVLRRFELKPGLQARIDRQQARLDACWTRYRGGEEPGGKHGPAIKEAGRAARREGQDASAAVEARVSKLKENIRQQAKKELRIWSPTLYAPGAVKRGGDSVTHVSCLVLDHDDGTTLQEASAIWSDWFHIAHTTWSHTPALHKFRLVLPLARPVPSERWADVWRWAEDRAGQSIDPACKSPASTYALPAVPRPDWPREAFSRAGALLDPVMEGIVPESPAPPDPARSDEAWLATGHPDASYIEHAPREGDDALDDWGDDVFSVCGDTDGSMVAAEHPPSPVPATARSVSLDRKLDQILSRLDRLLALAESGSGTVTALERLDKLVQRGALTAEEYEAAKAHLLEL